MSARVMLCSALVFVAARAILHALGLDLWVSVISGTPPPANVSIGLAALVAIGVIASQLACALVAPVLALAALIRVALDRWAARSVTP